MMISRSLRVYPEQVIEHIVTEHMRLSEDDGELLADARRCVRSAFDIAENHTNRIIVPCRAEFGLASWRKVLELPTAPVREVVEVRYLDLEGKEQVLDAESYVLSASEHRSMIEFCKTPELMADRTWNRIRIIAECGYVDSASDSDGTSHVLPAAIEAAVKLIAGTLFEAEGDTIIGRQVNELPISAQRLLQPYRITPYGWED